MLLGLLIIFIVVYLSLVFFWGGIYSLISESVYVFEYIFSTLHSSYISFSLIFDWISVFFIGLVCFISSIVFCYSCGYIYISIDKNFNRFIIHFFFICIFYIINDFKT